MSHFNVYPIPFREWSKPTSGALYSGVPITVDITFREALREEAMPKSPKTIRDPGNGLSKRMLSNCKSNNNKS